MEKLEKNLNKIPLDVINLLSVISGIITIVSASISLISAIISWVCSNKSLNLSFILIWVALIGVIVLLIFRTRKYKKIDFERNQIISTTYHKLTHDSRDLYFDVMRYHKDDKNENIRFLTEMYQQRLIIILGYLCNIMEKYCGQNITSCIKLITHFNDNDKIEDAILTTFCRSANSDSNRGGYERNTEIVLKNNTDFLYIVNPNKDTDLNYVYRRDLTKYVEKLRNEGRQYKNTNINWQNDYIGRIVTPIQIEHKRLYDSPKEDSYNLIGFLCVDSKSSSAFVERQEKFNVDIVKSFADIIYVLLAQYQHYLKKLSTSNLVTNNK